MEKSKFFNKRIKKDIDILTEIYPNHKLYTDEISNFITLEIFENSDTNIPIYKFVIKKFYPFAPPNVYYKNLSYENIYKISSQRVQKYLNLLTNNECLCCSSILCSNNWHLSFNFFDIISEINNYRKIKKNIFIKILADKIKNKYLINDINLDCYLFGV